MDKVPFVLKILSNEELLTLSKEDRKQYKKLLKWYIKGTPKAKKK